MSSLCLRSGEAESLELTSHLWDVQSCSQKAYATNLKGANHKLFCKSYSPQQIIFHDLCKESQWMKSPRGPALHHQGKRTGSNIFGGKLTQNALSKSKASITSDSAMRCGRSWIIASAIPRFRQKMQTNFEKNVFSHLHNLRHYFYIFLIKFLVILFYTSFILPYSTIQLEFPTQTFKQSKSDPEVADFFNDLTELIPQYRFDMTRSVHSNSPYFTEMVPNYSSSMKWVCFGMRANLPRLLDVPLCKALICATTQRLWPNVRAQDRIQAQITTQNRCNKFPTWIKHFDQTCCLMELKPVDIEQNVARGEIMGRVQKLGGKENVDWLADHADRPLPLSPNQSWRPLRCHQCIHPEIAIHKAKTCGDWSL